MTNPGERAAAQVVGTGKPTLAKEKRLKRVFKHLMDVHGEVFALIKRLGMSSEPQARRERCLTPRVPILSRDRGEMAEVHSALRELVQSHELALDDDAEASELADAIAALDAINPGSPEWAPAFLQMSELVEAHANETRVAVGTGR
jgi:hypothetical protein